MPDVSLETILVAVIAGLGGGLAGTWLRIRHEREEAFKGRQITAADDLSTGLQQAIIGLDEAYSTALKHAYFDTEHRVTFRHPERYQVAPETEEALSRAGKLIGEARGAAAEGHTAARLPRPHQATVLTKGAPSVDQHHPRHAYLERRPHRRTPPPR